MDEDKEYDFEEATKYPGLYRAITGSYILVTTGWREREDLPIHNGVIFIHYEVVDKGLGLTSSRSMVQTCNACTRYMYKKVESFDVRVILKVD